MWLKKHELAVRSEMLKVLADTPEEEVRRSKVRKTAKAAYRRH
jgi:flagellar FliL protein